MAYYGNAPADVALVVGSDVITTTEIQDATIATADIANDAITAVKIDDDGTGFQMGSLGLGTAVSGSEKLTVGGTASFTGNTTINGDCGIGTANPQESIHTTGNIRFGDSAPAELYTNSSELRLGVDRNNDNATSNITFYTNNDEKVRIDAGGQIISNVGGNSDVGLRLQRASSSGRAQYTLENESGAELWRCGLTGAGGTTYTFWNTSANVLQLSYSDNSATFAGGVTINDTDGSILSVNTTDSEGGYIIFQRSGTAKGYIGSSAKLINGASNDDLTLRAENNLQFSIGSTEAVKINSSSATFAGAVKAYGNSDTVAGLEIYSNSTHGMRILHRATDGDFSFERRVGGTNTEFLRIGRSTGNATFAGDATFSGRINVANIYAEGSDPLRLRTENSKGIEYLSDNDGHIFKTYSGSWQTRMFIHDNGDTGIGNWDSATAYTGSNPAERLHVVKYGLTKDSTQHTLQKWSTGFTGAEKGSNLSLKLSRYEEPGNNYPRTKVHWYVTGRTTDNSDTPRELMNWADNGDITITSGGYNGGIDTSDTGKTGFQFHSNGIMHHQIDYNSAGAEIILLNNIHSSGATCAFLQYRTRNATEGTLLADGSGLSISNASDYRKKERITDLSGSLDAINSLRPRQYYYREGFGKPTRAFAGFIAHELQDTTLSHLTKGIKDQVVTQEDLDNGLHSGMEVGDPVYQTVSYADNELITHLVKAVQELSDKVTALENA